MSDLSDLSDLNEVYLQEESFDDEGRSCERLWCKDAEVFENPIRYIRADFVAEREAKLITCLETTKQALTEINHAHLHPNWFTNGSKAANAHLRMWVSKGTESIQAILKSLGIEGENND